MHQESKDTSWSGAQVLELRMLPGGGAKAVDSWLAQNVRACSQQEYLRYREYLEAASPASAKEFEE